MYPWLARSRPPRRLSPRTPGTQRQHAAAGARMEEAGASTGQPHPAHPRRCARNRHHARTHLARRNRLGPHDISLELPGRDRRRAEVRPWSVIARHRREAREGQRRQPDRSAQGARRRPRQARRRRDTSDGVGIQAVPPPAGPGLELGRSGRDVIRPVGGHRPGRVRLRAARPVGRGRPGRRRPDRQQADPLHEPRGHTDRRRTSSSSTSSRSTSSSPATRTSSTASATRGSSMTRSTTAGSGPRSPGIATPTAPATNDDSLGFVWGAISTTGDPTGSYYQFYVLYNSFLPDFPARRHVRRQVRDHGERVHPAPRTRTARPASPTTAPA